MGPKLEEGVFNFPFKNHFQIKEIDPHIPDKLLFNQGAKTTQWEKMDGVLIGYSESNCPPNSGLWASARGMPFSGNPHHTIWAPLLGSTHTHTGKPALSVSLGRCAEPP